MKLEAELLPHTDLKPIHDKAIWLYVYQTFKKDPAARAADRIALRFSVTSWPQLMLVDPLDLGLLTNVGRSSTSFLKTFASATPKKAGLQAREDARRSLVQAERTARNLEERTDDGAAISPTLLDHPDIVVKVRALEVLAVQEPETVVKQAQALLATPNDTFRYLVCKVLATAGDPAAAPHLEALVASPAPSRNPNVLRIRAVQALARCGRAASVRVVAPFASTGAYFNGLTGIAITTLATLATRFPATRPEVERVLRSGYPSVAGLDAATPAGKRALRAAAALAKRIHKALVDPRPFPKLYDEAGRAKLMQPPLSVTVKEPK